jgi:hypothetical protein
MSTDYRQIAMSENLRRSLAFRGAVLGGVLGYFGTAFALCYIIMPESNMCGFFALPLGLPIGLGVGAVIGMILDRRRQ